MNRTYAPARVGDLFGRRRVVRLLPRDASSNERVLARCEDCGEERAAYVFNLRAHSGCKRCPRVSTRRRLLAYFRERAGIAA